MIYCILKKIRSLNQSSQQVLVYFFKVDHFIILIITPHVHCTYRQHLYFMIIDHKIKYAFNVSFDLTIIYQCQRYKMSLRVEFKVGVWPVPDQQSLVSGQLSHAALFEIWPVFKPRAVWYPTRIKLVKSLLTRSRKKPCRITQLINLNQFPTLKPGLEQGQTGTFPNGIRYFFIEFLL